MRQAFSVFLSYLFLLILGSTVITIPSFASFFSPLQIVGAGGGSSGPATASSNHNHKNPATRTTPFIKAASASSSASSSSATVNMASTGTTISSASTTSSSQRIEPEHPAQQQRLPPPPIVYTIAGSDSGGGAGIQADLHAIHAMGCHGCSAITCLTAQNSVGVTDVHIPPVAFLQQQLAALTSDLPPVAIKIGMLVTKDITLEVASTLRQLKEQQHEGNKIWIVLDPVMISTSGHPLIDAATQQAMHDHLFPLCDVITPNTYEAVAILDYYNDDDDNDDTTNDQYQRRQQLTTRHEIEQAAAAILTKTGVPAVLMKGGHTSDSKDYAQDYFLSAAAPTSSSSSEPQPRLCDGDRGVWFETRRYDTSNTHGTGCTLSSAMAAALALGEQQKRRRRRQTGATNDAQQLTMAMDLVDACCLGKAYVTAGIARSTQLGRGPGPVVQTTFPDADRYFPSILPSFKDSDGGYASSTESLSAAAFLPMSSSHHGDDQQRQQPQHTLGRILPIVSSVEWVERLCSIASNNNGEGDGITDIQFRIKGESDPTRILALIQQCQTLCKQANVRLWVNDYWEPAIHAGCFGVHVGQEDVVRCLEKGGIQALRDNNVALGISTHSYGELAVALGLRPSYISLGPIFATTSKDVAFPPQGLGTIRKWRSLIPLEIPLVVIGGIGDATTAQLSKQAGADCIAVIGAVTQATDPAIAVQELNHAMR